MTDQYAARAIARPFGSRANLTCGVLIALFAIVLQGPAHVASADPSRKALRRSQPASPAHAAPDVTSTIPVQKPPVVQDDETLPKPFDLPAAPRAKMRACGEKWQTIKMSGRAADQTWREFATKCLVEPDAPPTASP